MHARKHKMQELHSFLLFNSEHKGEGATAHEAERPVPQLPFVLKNTDSTEFSAEQTSL